jgi:hypothetical protein
MQTHTSHEILQKWTCPKCGRSFERHNQSHSCKNFPVEQHFEGKPYGKMLYKELARAVKLQLGNFKTESLECCIHFVTSFTFAAVKISKHKIIVDFSLSRKIKSKRIKQAVQISANRYLYYADVNTADEIDSTLIAWLIEAANKKTLEK